MKTTLTALGLICLLLVSTLSIPGIPASQTIRLPEDTVTMNAVYGIHSYFMITLTDVPAGYDITNGTYQGWCVQKTILMIQHVNHTVLLYTTDDPSLPTGFQSDDWDKITYILNHKRGTRDSIQKAIWYYTNNDNITTDANATKMVDDAEHNGSGFIPTNGEILAIPIQGGPTIQRCFLELALPLLPLSSLEGLVWYDADADGLQDGTEHGIENIIVHLYQQDTLLIQTITTNTQGYYNFSGITPGNYSLQFIPPMEYLFTLQDIGDNDTTDSDADRITGKTIIFPVGANESITTWDAGMYRPSPKRPSHRNHKPAADGTAGEPYQGFAHEPLTFDGSRSYDTDGRIISWRWNFGDGTIGTGETITHAYDQAGNYTVTLTVTDNWYAADVYTSSAYITIGNNPSSTPLISGPTFGHANILYQYTVLSTDPDKDTLLYVVDWGDGASSTSPLFGSGHIITTTHQWTKNGFYMVRVYALDRNYASSNVYELVVAIDVQYVKDLGYLLDKNSDGIFDVFHSNITVKETKINLRQSGYYYIDTDGDERWDIVYDPVSHQLQTYHETPLLDYLIFAILVISFLLILYFGRKRKQSIIITHRKE